MKTFATITLVCLFAFLPLVSAHGYVKAIAIDGTWYDGNKPGSNEGNGSEAESRSTFDRPERFDIGPSPIRTITDVGPVKGANNTDIKCGLGAQNAAMVVPANPGSVFSVQWSGSDGTDNVCAYQSTWERYSDGYML